jgi:quercetin dioxygenase-like cupin family protein
MTIGTVTETGPRTRTFEMMGATINVKVTSEETGDTFSVIELSIPPHFPGAPPHYHEQMPEHFHLLSGKIDVLINDTWTPVLAGEHMLIQPGIVHAYRNNYVQPARFLVIAPGHDRFFFELMDWMRAEPIWPPKDRQALLDFGRRHDVIYI